MQDNFTYDIMQQLIRYLDGELSPSEKTETEKLLLEDAAVKERFENLLSTKDAIKALGYKKGVQALHERYYFELKGKIQIAEKRTPVFRRNINLIVRIAAVFFFAIAIYGVYDYSTTNRESLFTENFISYQLTATRGDRQYVDYIDSLYQEKNFNAVIREFQLQQQRSQKDYFLTALAYLERSNNQAAIEAFKNVQILNSNLHEKYFAQETEYYLALAYIKAGNIDEAKKQLDTILANKQHLFYQKAAGISRLKLKILQLKE